MPVPVMLVWNMRVRMPHRLVAVQVTVHSGEQRIVTMGVVPIIVAVSMLMFRRVVLMFVPMTFREVKDDARRHQQRAGLHPGAAAAFTEHEGEQRADERSEREHRAGACCAERSLGQQVETQAQSVAGRTHCEQGERGR